MKKDYFKIFMSICILFIYSFSPLTVYAEENEYIFEETTEDVTEFDSNINSNDYSNSNDNPLQKNNNDEISSELEENGELICSSYKEEAVNLQLNTTNSFILNEYNTRKVYKIYIEKDAILSYSGRINSEMYAFFSIIDENENLIDEKDLYTNNITESGNFNGEISLSKGYYYLVYSNYYGYSASISFSSNLYYPRSTEIEKNDRFGNSQTISIDSTQYGVLTYGDESDIYKVNIDYDGIMKFNFEGKKVGQYSDGYYINIYDSNFEKYSYFWDSYNEGLDVYIASKEIEMPQGIYYIQVRSNYQGYYNFNIELTNPSYGVITTSGIYCSQNYPSIKAGINIQKSRPDDIVEYRWVACNNNEPDNWFEISPWTRDNNWIDWTPKKSGGYVFVCYARIVGKKESEIQSSFGTEYHKQIKGICQMPYTGPGGGYLIGIESYDNPNHSYKYEMLILDCNLYMQGKDAWVYTTGKCGAPENCLWTIWQPQYGYYWTLFRIYDSNDNLIDEACYGFENVY